MHFCLSFRLAAALLFVCTAAAPAAAQSDAPVPQSDAPGPQAEVTLPSREFDSYRIVGWSFTPALAAGVVYDSNVDLSAASAGTGDTQGDSLFTIVPSGQLAYLGKRTDFSVGYRGFVRRYAKVEGLAGFEQRGELGLRRALSRRLSVYFRDSFSDSPTTDEADVNGVPFQRTGSRRNALSTGGEFRLTKFTTVGAQYDNTWIHFERDADSPFLSGGWIHGGRTEVRHQLNERLSLGGEYAYRTASIDEGTREFAFQDGGVTGSYALGPHTSASAAGGISRLVDRNAGESRTGPYVRLGINRTFELFTAGASFSRIFLPSFGFGGASASQDLRGFVRMPLGRRFFVQGSSSWRRTQSFEVGELELDTYALRSTVGYLATRWARAEALYTFTRQDSSVTGGEINRHRVGLQVVVSQPMRIR